MPPYTNILHQKRAQSPDMPHRQHVPYTTARYVGGLHRPSSVSSSSYMTGSPDPSAHHRRDLHGRSLTPAANTSKRLPSRQSTEIGTPNNERAQTTSKRRRVHTDWDYNYKAPVRSSPGLPAGGPFDKPTPQTPPTVAEPIDQAEWYEPHRSPRRSNTSQRVVAVARPSPNNVSDSQHSPRRRESISRPNIQQPLVSHAGGPSGRPASEISATSSDDAFDYSSASSSAASSEASESSHTTAADGPSPSRLVFPDILRNLAPEDRTKCKEHEANAALLVLETLELHDIGCTAIEHDRARQEHEEGHNGAFCEDLSTTYGTQPLTTRRAGRVKVGLECKTFPNPAELNRGMFEEARFMQRQFEGKMASGEEPVNVCLHNEHLPVSGAAVEYDFDALIVASTTLEAIRTQTSLFFTRQTQYNIASDLHIALPIQTTNARGDEVDKNVQPRDIPHLFIGTLREFSNGRIFVLFPRLYGAGGPGKNKGGNWLSDDQARKFFDAWIAALRKVMASGDKQYIPPDYATAVARAAAHSQEHQASQHDRGKNHRSYTVGAFEVGRAWKRFQEQVAADKSGLGMFRDAIILFNAKNTKLEFSSPSLLAAFERFNVVMQRTFDASRMEYFADVAVKIVPPDPQVHNGGTTGVGRHREEGSVVSSYEDDPGFVRAREGRTYLWRACCLKTLHKKLRLQAFDSMQGRAQIYNNGYLRDATCMNITTPKRSWIRRGGVAFIQCYNSAKEFEDAQQIHPFDHDRLANLSLDADLHHKDNLSNQRSSLTKSYCGSKARVAQTYRSWCWTSPGCRIEFRISGNVFAECLAELQRRYGEMDDDGEANSPPTPPETVDFLWCVPTPVWCDFMRHNLDKITSLIEIIVLSNPVAGITLPSSELLFALFTYLKGFSNCQPQRKSLLWKRKRKTDQGREYGLALGSSMKRYGFGWITSVVNWQDLRLKSVVAGKMIGCRVAIGSSYKPGMRLGQNDRQLMELCHKHIQTSAKDSPRQQAAMLTAAHYILRQYRRDVLALIALRKELKAAFLHHDQHDSIPFCDQALREALSQPPHYVNNYKVVGAYDPGALYEWIMGLGPVPQSRDYMTRKKYRGLLTAIEKVVSFDAGVREAWHSRLRAQFQKYIWAIPYPDTNGTFISTEKKSKKRTFFAAGTRAGNWVYLRKEPLPGLPPTYPATLGMSFEELQLYLSRL